MSALLPWVLVSGALVASILAFLRLGKGPGQADRIVALDVVFSSTITVAAAAALVTGRALYLDVGVGLAMVGFVATIVWARLIDASAPSCQEPAEEGEEGPP